MPARAEVDVDLGSFPTWVAERPHEQAAAIGVSRVFDGLTADSQAVRSATRRQQLAHSEESVLTFSVGYVETWHTRTLADQRLLANTFAGTVPQLSHPSGCPPTHTGMVWPGASRASRVGSADGAQRRYALDTRQPGRKLTAMGWGASETAAEQQRSPTARAGSRSTSWRERRKIQSPVERGGCAAAPGRRASPPHRMPRNHRVPLATPAAQRSTAGTIVAGVVFVGILQRDRP